MIDRNDPLDRNLDRLRELLLDPIAADTPPSLITRSARQAPKAEPPAVERLSFITRILRRFGFSPGAPLG